MSLLPPQQKLYEHFQLTSDNDRDSELEKIKQLY